MNIRSSLFGPQSKYDRSLPYTYVARVCEIAGIEEITSAYFADTICGLIDYLEAHNIAAKDVRLFGLYVDREIPLELRYCVDESGHWLQRPDICHSLEQHYHESLDFQYKGHHETDPCEYEDRERQGSGPY